MCWKFCCSYDLADLMCFNHKMALNVVAIKAVLENLFVVFTISKNSITSVCTRSFCVTWNQKI